MVKFTGECSNTFKDINILIHHLIICEDMCDEIFHFVNLFEGFSNFDDFFMILSIRDQSVKFSMDSGEVLETSEFHSSN